MSEALSVDKREVRRAFERAAQTYDAAAVLQHEVCARMLERLDYIKIAPRAILDAGSGTGNALNSLMARYSGKPVVALDIALPMLKHGQARLRWWHSMPGLRPPLHAVCADLERLPLGNATVGFIWSNLALQWVNDLPGTLAQIHRILKKDGLFLAMFPGGETLK